MLTVHTGHLVEGMAWTKEKPTEVDFAWALWRADATARPYAVMFYGGAWRFGDEIWITPTRGEWCPISLPTEEPSQAWYKAEEVEEVLSARIRELVGAYATEPAQRPRIDELQRLLARLRGEK